jgi:hypothetical protein
MVITKKSIITVTAKQAHMRTEAGTWWWAWQVRESVPDAHPGLPHGGVHGAGAEPAGAGQRGRRLRPGLPAVHARHPGAQQHRRRARAAPPRHAGRHARAHAAAHDPRRAPPQDRRLHARPPPRLGRTPRRHPGDDQGGMWYTHRYAILMLPSILALSSFAFCCLCCFLMLCDPSDSWALPLRG